MPTFVHTADIHFDTPFSARFSSKQAELRRKEIMQTFREIITAAGEKDMLFISGDLFDSRYVSGETVAFLKRCFGAIPNTHVFISAGNHDPLTNDSVYLTENFGENVHIFKDKLEYVDLPELKTRIHGVSFKNSREEEELFENPEICAEWCNILVIHGDMGSVGNSGYNPIDKSKIENSGMDYVALGHIHKYSGIEKLGNTVYAYPGIPEGRGFDESGEKGYITGSVEKGKAEVMWNKISSRQFLIEEIDVSGCEDSLRLLELAIEKIEEKGTENIYRIVLTGKINRSLINTELLNDQLKAKAFYADVKDKTRPDYDLNEIVAEGGLKGEFAAKLLNMIEDMPEEEKEIGYMAINIGLEAMERGQGL